MVMICRHKYFLVLLLGIYCLAGCKPDSQGQNPEKDITVFFCPPCKEKVHELIRQAEKSIDIAMYDLSSPSVIDELIKAHKKGVKIRIIIERRLQGLFIKDNKPEVQQHERIRNAGIPLKLSKEENISFHHKNMIIDGKTVFVGSMNLNMLHLDKGRYLENYLLITDPITVKQFSDHFESVLHYKPVTNALHKTNNGKGIDTHFAPAKDFAGKIIGLVKNAKTHVDIIVPVLTHEPLLNELIAAQKRGVKVRVVTCFFYSSRKKFEKLVGAADRLRKAGVDIRLDPKKTNHNKILVIDEAIVQTGSPGYDAQPLVSRYETAVFIYSKELAKVYLSYTRPFHEKAIKVDMDFDFSSY